MSAPVRFLAVAVFGWVTVRAAAQALWIEPLPPIALPPSNTPLPDVAGASTAAEPAPTAMQVEYGAMQPYPAGYPSHPAAYPAYPTAYPAPRPYPVPIYYPVPAQSSPYPAALSRGRQSAPEWPGQEPAPGPDFGDMPRAGEAPGPKLALLDGGDLPRAKGLPSFVGGKPAAPPKLDRLSLAAWALVRQPTAVVINRRAPPTAPVSLASGGQLGGSQAGARLTYRFSRALAANLRVSAPVTPETQKRMAGEAALGVSWTPLRQVPLRVMAERRQSFGGPAGGGRNAFAVLAEGGVSEQPLPWGFRLDGYGQAGAVSLRERAWFVDGGATVGRPLFGRFSLGAGVWGGAQRGLARLDVGPRLSMQLFPGVRTHLDYRYRLKGQALPGSGYAVTVGADF